MSLSLIRTAIYNKLDSISNVGKVQDYRRHTIDWDEIYSFYSENGVINVAIFEWRSAPQEKVASGSIVLKRIHTFRVFYLYSLKDATASAKTFEGIVEEILDEFTGSQDLISKVRWSDDNPPSLITAEEVMFSNYLCHRAEIELTYEEQVSF